jgi:Fe2+ or Zn2+ uptake regulation protein
VAATAMRQTKKFSRINDHSMELFGVCKKCDTKK